MYSSCLLSIRSTHASYMTRVIPPGYYIVVGPSIFIKPRARVIRRGGMANHCVVPSLFRLDISLHVQQPLYNLGSHKLRQPQHALPRNKAIGATILPATHATIYKPPIAINFHTPKNVLWPRNPPVVGRIPQIANMNPTAVAGAPSAALVHGPARAVITARFRGQGETAR